MLRSGTTVYYLRRSFRPDPSGSALAPRTSHEVRRMKAKLKIEETRAGFRCRVCGRRFRTEEAAFVHQSYDCVRPVRGMEW